jgi:hypothetical protein
MFKREKPANLTGAGKKEALRVTFDMRITVGSGEVSFHPEGNGLWSTKERQRNHF